jgi:hypothetical protein
MKYKTGIIFMFDDLSVYVPLQNLDIRLGLMGVVWK